MALQLVLPMLSKVLHLLGPIVEEEGTFLLTYKTQLQRLCDNVKFIYDFLEGSTEGLSPHRNFNAIVEKAEKLGVDALQLVIKCKKWDERPNHRSAISPVVLFQHYKMGRRIAELNQDFVVLHEDIRTFSDLQQRTTIIRQNETIIRQNEQSLKYQATLVHQVSRMDRHLRRIQPVIVQNVNMIHINSPHKAFPQPGATSLEF